MPYCRAVRLRLKGLGALYVAVPMCEHNGREGCAPGGDGGGSIDYTVVRRVRAPSSKKRGAAGGREKYT